MTHFGPTDHSTWWPWRAAISVNVEPLGEAGSKLTELFASRLQADSSPPRGSGDKASARKKPACRRSVRPPGAMPVLVDCEQGTVLGAVAKLVGIEGGVVSGCFNPNESSVDAPDRRPRHDEHYHEARCPFSLRPRRRFISSTTGLIRSRPACAIGFAISSRR